jgi:hypothetical protein
MYIKELPIYGERATFENINNNNIVAVKINNKREYCIVVDKTNTMIKIKKLNILLEENKIIFTINDDIDETTKNYLSFSRKIFKLQNIVYNLQ